MITNKIKYIVLIASVPFWGCAQEESITTSIPYARVEIDIHTKVEHSFDNPYNSKTYTEGYTGYGGVIAISNADASYIYAFDMCCPYNVTEKNIVKTINSLQVQCPKCKTIYNIADGSGRVISGASKERLRTYRVIRDGDYYRIRN